MIDSCQHCDACEHGRKQYCAEGSTYVYNSNDRVDHIPTYGRYSDNIVVSDKFVMKVPDGLDLAGAAPPLRAGITKYSPLRHWNIGKSSKVAVVGLGRLGHMRLTLTRAKDAEVTLFTCSLAKQHDARRPEAGKIVLSTNVEKMRAVNGRFDLTIDTVSCTHYINPYIPTLFLDSTLVLVSYLGPLDPLLNSAPMIMGRKSAAGLLISGIAETQEMLDFCSKHGITSDIEVIKIEEVNAVYEHMLKSDVKYCVVIDMGSLKTA